MLFLQDTRGGCSHINEVFFIYIIFVKISQVANLLRSRDNVASLHTIFSVFTYPAGNCFAEQLTF